MSCIFLLLSCLVIFDWIPDTLNFTSSSDRYFCTPINILELFPLCWDPVKLLRNIWSFWVLFLQFLSQELIFSHYRSTTLLCTLPSAPWITKFSSLACGNRYYSWLWLLGSTTSNPLGYLFPSALRSFFTCTHWSSVSRTLRGTLLIFSECTLCAVFSSTAILSWELQLPWSFSDPQQHLSTQGVIALPLCFLHSELQPMESLKSISWNSLSAHLICSPALRDPLLPGVQCLENLFHIFYLGEKSGPFYFIMARIRKR